MGSQGLNLGFQGLGGLIKHFSWGLKVFMVLIGVSEFYFEDLRDIIEILRVWVEVLRV